MTTTPRHEPRRKLDAVNLALLLIGVAFGALSYWLITTNGENPLILVPSVVVATLGATHLTKLELPRQ